MPTQFKRLLLCSTVLLLSGGLFGCVSSVANDGNFVAEDNPSVAQGIWAAEGYGWWVEIGEDSFVGYDVAGDFCAKNPELSGPNEGFPTPFLSDPERQAIRIMLAGDPAYKYELRKQKALPATCAVTPKPDSVTVFEAFDTLMREHYVFFQERSVDWDALSISARARVTPELEDTELFEIMASLINQIDDAHLSLSAEIDGESHSAKPGRGETGRSLRALAEARNESPQDIGEAWRQSVQSGIERDILRGRGEVVGNGWIRYGVIDENVGYLSIMAEYNYVVNDGDSHAEIEKIMDDVMARFQGVDAVILDISLNHGGSDGISRRIARRFAKKQIVAYSKFAGDAHGAPPQEILLRPTKSAISYLGPVYLLTSDHTVSAGEILTMSLKGLPNVVHIGGTTRGSLSDILSKQLPNGWQLNLSNEIYADRHGVVWEGKGVPPEIELNVFSANDPFSGHVLAVRKVQQHISKGR